MSKSRQIPANNLKDAFNILDPQHSISPSQVSTLFVKRPGSETITLSAQFQVSERPLKILFIGHVGSGKSSEMSYLADLLKDQFLSVPVFLYNIFQSPKINYAEVILAMNISLLRIATDSRLFPKGAITETWQKYLKDRYIYLKRWLFGIEPADEAILPDQITVKLKLFMAELESRIGREFVTRSKARDEAEKRVSEMINQMGDVALKIQKAVNKKILFIVEDLDKFDLIETRDLFLGHSKTLTSPNVNIVYTFPISMRYANEFMQIQKAFDGKSSLPNISLKKRNGDINEDGWKCARDILSRRIKDNLFEPGAKDLAIKLSGGHVKTLIQLTQQSVLSAIVDKSLTVSQNHLISVAAKLRDDYIPILSKKDLKALRDIRKDEDKDLYEVEENKLSLLSNGSLLEYGNTKGPWADVNPIVEEIINRL